MSVPAQKGSSFRRRTARSRPRRVKLYARFSLALRVAGKRNRSTRSTDAGILERLGRSVVLGDGGYLLELEKRGYVQPGPFTPEVVVQHPAAVRELHQE